MHEAESTGRFVPPAIGSPRLFKKQRPEDTPVTAKSVALFRFGEQCNNRCPMCSNTGEASLFFHSTAELVRRAGFLHSCGFPRVMVTGGEPTIHPGFWTIIERLAADAMVWDINTHGRTFSREGFARRAAEMGLERAIVSLHSFDAATSAAIFGVDRQAHEETVAGVDRLLDAGVGVMLNCVLTRLNLPRLEEDLREGARRYGRRVAFKFVFPSTIGKGGQWPGIAMLRYRDVREPVQRLRALGAAMHLRVFFESFPNCVLQDPGAVNLGRSGFGETHYLDDATGGRVYAMRHIEAELSAFGEACRQCSALRRCPGVALAYARQHGVDELIPYRTRRPTAAAARTVST
jgi:MoaA/NifB/PqqE/SkfB family radical SAM enzyme